jgi:hypothetical protein
LHMPSTVLVAKSGPSFKRLEDKAYARCLNNILAITSRSWKYA